LSNCIEVDSLARTGEPPIETSDQRVPLSGSPDASFASGDAHPASTTTTANSLFKNSYPSAIEFSRMPTLSISISTLSPGFIHTGGVRRAPTPPGVPVTSTSPG